MPDPEWAEWAEWADIKLNYSQRPYTEKRPEGLQLFRSFCVQKPVCKCQEYKKVLENGF